MAAEFSWASAADVGLGLLDSFGKWQLADAKAGAAKVAADSANVLGSANRDLAATVRGINNRALMTHAGKQLDAGSRTAARFVDSVVKGGFETSIKDAEVAGKVAQRNAASGLGGAGIQAIGATVALTQARAEQYRLDSAGQQEYEYSTKLSSVLGSAFASQDITPATSDFRVAPQGGADLSSMLIAGLLDKRSSLQTMLGSLHSYPSEAARSFAVASGSADPNPLPTFQWEEAVPHPVADQTDLQPTPLGPITVK
jgi:hypothetical protein